MTIRPDFTATVPNFDGRSRENYEVSRDAELSRIPNPVPILSRFECNVTSHVDKVYRQPIGLIHIPNSLSSDAFFRAQNAPNPFLAGAPPWTPLGKLTTFPLVGWGGGHYSKASNRRDMISSPYLTHTSPLESRCLGCLDLGAFSASNSVPIFYGRFMVTLCL